MEFTGFPNEIFGPRMDALKKRIRPKLKILGSILSQPFLPQQGMKCLYMLPGLPDEP